MADSRSRSNSPPDNPYYDSGRLHVLQLLLCSRLDELFETLGVSLQQTAKMFVGCCPIHSGDNVNALNLYKTGDTLPGYWKCNTRNCHETFKPTILGFVRGVLSHQRFDWASLRDRKAHVRQKTLGFRETVDWCCQFVGQKLADIKVDYADLEKRQFSAGVSILTRRPEQEKHGITRGQIRPRLVIPASYFVDRGWSAETLNRYDVGLCSDKTKPLYSRIVVPVYDDEYRFVVGFTARSVFDRCGLCRLWHDPQMGCPNDDEKLLCSKWRNNKLNVEHYLYNYWFARKHIRQSGVVCLCEGPGDVWRLEEAGIHVSVGMFGANLSDAQQVILETSGATDVVILTNMDEAGRDAKEKVKQRLKRSFRLHAPDLPAKDLGELRSLAVGELLNPLLEQIRKRNV